LRHFPLRELGYAIGFIVVLAALYVDAYYATMEKSRQHSGAFRFGPKIDAAGVSLRAKVECLFRADP
jgi:hypothetical protein